MEVIPMGKCATNCQILQTQKLPKPKNTQTHKTSATGKKTQGQQNAAITEMICRSKNTQTRETHVEEKCCQYGKTHKTQKTTAGEKYCKFIQQNSSAPGHKGEPVL